MAKFKKHTIKFMCIVSVVFTFLTALFYPIDNFQAAVVELCTDYHYPDKSFPSIHATLWEAPEGVVNISDYSVISDAYFFTNNNGYNFISSPDYKYRFYGYFTITDSSTLSVKFGSGTSPVVSNVAYTAQYYVMFNGQEYPCYSSDGSTYFFIFEAFGSGFSYFDLKCEIDALVDFDFLVDEYGIPDSANYSFTSSVTNFYFTLTQYSGADILEPVDVLFYDVFLNSNSLQQQSNTITQSILDKITEAFGLSGDETLEDVPTDDMTDLGQKEDNLLGSTSPDDAANSIDVTIDADSSAVIWDIINDFVTSNDVVFGGFISLLSLGVIALILNR